MSVERLLSLVSLNQSLDVKRIILVVYSLVKAVAKLYIIHIHVIKISI